jgi:hypothetical protein
MKNLSESDIKLLIDEAAAMDREIKVIQPHLKAAKETLTDVFLDQGRPKALEGDESIATARYTEVYDALDPSVVYDRLKELGRHDRFFSCIKIDMAKLRKVLPAEDIRELQGESIGTKVAISFKERPDAS